MANDTTRPVIGLTSYFTEATWDTQWHREAALLPETYLRSVADAGGCPVLLPPIATNADVVRRLDGVVITGGADVSPELYGAEPDPSTTPQPFRDEHEVPLIEACEKYGVPMLCVCRGFQLLNAVHGGTLYQDLPTQVEGGERYVNEGTVFNTNTVSVDEGTLTASILGTGAEVASYHHQGVQEVGEGLVVTARSDDGLPQIMEYADSARSWMLATQFHPEERRLADPRIFAAFVEACRS